MVTSVFNEPTVDFHLNLNEKQFHIPNELLKRNLKQCQRLIDKEVASLNQGFAELDAMIKNPSGDAESIEKLNDMIIKIEKFERKISKKVNVELQLLQRIEARIKYYKELDDIKKANDQPRLIAWYQSYTTLLIGDYLARNGNFHEVPDDPNDCSPPPARLKRKLSSASSQVTNATSVNDNEHIHMNPGVEYLKQQGLDLLVDYDILLTTNKISKQLTVEHELGPLLDWIKENSAYLKSIASTLEFEARFQEYIEYVKIENYAKAIACFQTHLVKFIHANPVELTLAAGLLVFIKTCKSNMSSLAPNPKPDEVAKRQSLLKAKDDCWSFFFLKLPKSSKKNVSNGYEGRPDSFTNTMDIKRYMVLLDDKRWEKLNEMFLKAYYSMYGISYHDPLLIYLSLGISSLKTKDCLHQRQSSSSSDSKLSHYLNSEVLRNNCPVCSSEFAPIAEKLPHAHQVQSRLFENPVMLPSGNVYDSEKLRQLALTLRKRNLAKLEPDEVLDPTTGQTYKFSDFVTMFPT
ncbi:HDL212Cp [Eremothecium sinecaudum]|uniref:HDL212Cp n=1 Tax=Eremothecium sinecaudum TaxID=45286 RepID=A0A0X8HS96_9SACH|nr:HDL212Cp [Eremothecium sinecaudum]AMD20532.1 HDL212Cp [Eremothecium sinecaudum]